MASKPDTTKNAPRPFLYYDEENGQKTFGWLTPKQAAIRSAEKRAPLREEKTTEGDYVRKKTHWKRRTKSKS